MVGGWKVLSLRLATAKAPIHVGTRWPSSGANWSQDSSPSRTKGSNWTIEPSNRCANAVKQGTQNTAFHRFLVVVICRTLVTLVLRCGDINWKKKEAWVALMWSLSSFFINYHSKCRRPSTTGPVNQWRVAPFSPRLVLIFQLHLMHTRFSPWFEFMLVVGGWRGDGRNIRTDNFPLKLLRICWRWNTGSIGRAGVAPAHDSSHSHTLH